MTKESKLILKIGFIAYFIIKIIDFIGLLDIESLDSITKFGIISIPMTTIILIAYVWDRGEDNLAKIAIGLIFVDIIISLLRVFGVVEYSYATTKMTSKVVSVISYIASGGLHICYLLALFSIIPNEDSSTDMLKALAIGAYFIATMIGASEYVIEFESKKLIINICSFLSSLSAMGEYGFIVKYLLNKKIDDVAEIKKENPILQQTTIAPQQIPSMTQPTTVPLQQMPQQPAPMAAVPQIPQQPAPIAAVPQMPQQSTIPFQHPYQQ